MERIERATRFLVELDRPATGWPDIRRVADEARVALASMDGDGTRVRFLRTIYIPEDESCLLLYEGASEAAVREAAARASLGVQRVVQAIRAGQVPAE